MAGYTATSWTLTKLADDIIELSGGNRLKPQRTATYKIVLDSGGQVPAAGVPIPRGAMGFKKRPSYFLHNDVDSSFTTASARCLHWVINASGETVRAFRWTCATGTATNVGGRAIRRLATTVTLDVTHALFVTCNGW